MDSGIISTQPNRSLKIIFFSLRKLAICFNAFLLLSSFALNSYGQNAIATENAKPGNPVSEWGLVAGATKAFKASLPI